MTNFIEWGNEYLREADVLKKRMDKLKREKKSSNITREQYMELGRQINLMYAMYLDCCHIGKYLQGIETGEAKYYAYY